MFLAGHPAFKSYYQFGCKDASSDEVVFETFRNISAIFAKDCKAHFRVVMPQLDMYFTHGRSSLDDLIITSGIERKSADDMLKLSKFNTFCVVKCRNKLHPLLEKIRDKKLKLMEFERNSKFGDWETELFVVASGKKVAFLVQTLIEFLVSGSPFYDIYSSFPFDNCTMRRVPFEFKRFMKGAVNVTEKWSISDRILKGKGKDISRNHICNDTRAKKDQLLKIIDAGQESTHGVFFGSEIFGKNLAKLLRIVAQNNADFKLIIE